MVKCLAQGHKCHGRDSNPSRLRQTLKSTPVIVLALCCVVDEKIEKMYSDLFVLKGRRFILLGKISGATGFHKTFRRLSLHKISDYAPETTHATAGKKFENTTTIIHLYRNINVYFSFCCFVIYFVYIWSDS